MSESGTVGPIEVDEAFDLLANRRRQMVIEALVEDGETDLRSLADLIAFRETDAVTQSDVTSTQRKRVYIALYQTHLPTLEEAGVIELHDSTYIVETTPLTEVYATILEEVGDYLGGAGGLTCQPGSEEVA